MKTKTDLEKFYQVVSNDTNLMKQLDSISDRKNFLTEMVKLGAKKKYTFTISEVEASINSSTTSGQGDYFCLPVGCWTKAKSTVCEI